MLTLPFVVFDSNTPAASATLNKTIVVVSPCDEGLIFCPGAAQVCGSSTCSVRSALNATQALFAPVPPSFSVMSPSLLEPLAQLNATQLTFFSACDTAWPFSLAVCGTKHAGVPAWGRCDMQAAVSTTSVADAPVLTVVTGTNCTFDDVAAGNCARCSLDTIQAGNCPASEQLFGLHLTDVESEATTAVNVTVVMGALLSTANVTVQLEATPTVPSDAGVAALIEHASQVLAAAASSALSAASVPITACEAAGTGGNVSVVFAPSGAALGTATDTVQLAVEATVRLAARSVVHPGSNAASATECLDSVVQGALSHAALADVFATAWGNGGAQLVSLTAVAAAAQAASCVVTTPEAAMQQWLEGELVDLVGETQLVADSQVRMPSCAAYARILCRPSQKVHADVLQDKHLACVQAASNAVIDTAEKEVLQSASQDYCSVVSQNYAGSFSVVTSIDTLDDTLQATSSNTPSSQSPEEAVAASSDAASASLSAGPVRCSERLAAVQALRVPDAAPNATLADVADGAAALPLAQLGTAAIGGGSATGTGRRLLARKSRGSRSGSASLFPVLTSDLSDVDWDLDNNDWDLRTAPLGVEVAPRRRFQAGNVLVAGILLHLSLIHI